MLSLQKYFLALTFLFISSSLFSQLTTFEKFYGNDSTDDFLNNIQATDDGGYVAVGESQNSSNSGDFYLMKINSNGAVEMSKKLGTSDIETAYAIAVLDDRYVIGGSTFVDGENMRNCYLITVDFDGNILQEVTFGGEGDDVIYAVTSLENGDIAIAASYEDIAGTGANFHLRRYTSTLDLLAEIDYDNQWSDYPSFIVEDKNSGNILAGGTSNARGFLMNCSPQLDMILWTISGAPYSYSSFRTGVDYNDDLYAIGIKKSNAYESYIGLIDKITGEYEELIPLPDPNVGSYWPLKMEKKNNLIYLFISRSNTTPEKLLLKYDIVDDSFSEEFILPYTAKDMTIQEAEKIAVVSEISSDIYKADLVQEFDENVDENWSYSVGDLGEYTHQIGEKVIEADNGHMYLGGEIKKGSNLKTNAIIHKIDSEGTIIWESEFAIGEKHKFAGIAKTADDGCVASILYSLSGNLLKNLAFQKFNSRRHFRLVQRN